MSQLAGRTAEHRRGAARRPVSVSVGGGKGGVGKSVVAGNLAIALAQHGMRTVLVDLDLGAANQHTLLGIDRPQRTLQGLLDKDVASLEHVLVPTGVPRLFLVPGIGAIPGAANLAHAQKLKLLRHVERLDADFVVIDVGAGVSFNVIDFFEHADLRLVVTTPQLPSLQNAHCFMKGAIHRAIRRRIEARGAEGREAFEQSWRRVETERLGELRRRLRELDPAFQDDVERVTGGFATRLVGNMLETSGQERVLAALSRMARDFLEVEVPVGAALRQSAEMHASVTHRRPLLLTAPDHPAATALRGLAESLMAEDVSTLRAARSGGSERADRGTMPPEIPVGVEESLGAPLVAYLRRDERTSVNLSVELRARSGRYPCRALDLSRHGVRVAGVDGVALLEAVTVAFVELPGQPTLHGIVRHVPAGAAQLGIELHAGLEEACERILAAASASPADGCAPSGRLGGISWTSQP